MDPNAVADMAVVWMFFMVLGLIVTILWIFVPFAIFGIKPKLDQLIAEQRKTNELLAAQQLTQSR